MMKITGGSSVHYFSHFLLHAQWPQNTAGTAPHIFMYIRYIRRCKYLVRYEEERDVEKLDFLFTLIKQNTKKSIFLLIISKKKLRLLSDLYFSYFLVNSDGPLYIKGQPNMVN